jgi:hypothetical protein
MARSDPSQVCTIWRPRIAFVESPILRRLINSSDSQKQRRRRPRPYPTLYLPTTSCQTLQLTSEKIWALLCCETGESNLGSRQCDILLSVWVWFLDEAVYKLGNPSNPDDQKPSYANLAWGLSLRHKCTVSTYPSVRNRQLRDAALGCLPRRPQIRFVKVQI